MAEDDVSTRPAPDAIDDGVPATEEVPPELIETGDDGTGEMPPGDQPRWSVARGVTAAEQLAGETLDERLREELPDRVGGGRRTARQLYEPGGDDGEGGLFDDEADLIAEEDAILEDTLAPEEAAMRITRRPGGINNDPDPGYVDEP
jgi:hypothetical protein